MLLCDMLFVIFFFFANKLMYSASHFIGTNQVVNAILRIDSFLNLIFEIGCLIFCAVKISVLHAIVLLAVSLVANLVINYIVSKVILSNLVKKGWDKEDIRFANTYDDKCDAATTTTGLIGIPINIIIIILLCYFKFSL